MKCYLIKNSQKKKKKESSHQMTFTRKESEQEWQRKRIEEANTTRAHKKDWYGKAREKIAEGDNRMFGIR